MPAQILEPSIFNQESWGDVRFADFERTKTLVVLGPVRVKFGNKTLVLGPGSVKFGNKSSKSRENLKRFRCQRHLREVEPATRISNVRFLTTVPLV